MFYYSDTNELLRYTPTVDPFPETNPEWFVGGLPDSINTEGPGLVGDPIDYIPVDLISKSNISNDNLNIGGNRDIYDGYLDTEGNFHAIVPSDIPLRNIGAGSRALTFFYKKDSLDWLKGCKVHGKGKWVLLSDFGGIEPGSTSSKTISYTHGVNNTSAQSLSFTVGMKIGGTAEGITGELSASLTQTFSTSISITEQTTVSDTVEFQAQDREQRVGAYQFYRNYYVEPGQAFIDLKNKQINEPRSPFYHDVNRSFGYKTVHFHKVYVLAPDVSTSILANRYYFNYA